jgi:hypothetical protein
MKPTHQLIIASSLILLVTAVRAESPSERDLKQLKEQYDKTIAVTIEPHSKRYKASLEQLLKRATQANELDAAIKIREQLATLSEPVATSSKLTKQQLQRKLSDTTWIGQNAAGSIKIHFLPEGGVVNLAGKNKNTT